MDKVFRFAITPVRPLTDSSIHFFHTFVLIAIIFFVCSIMYYSYLCPTSVQLLALGACVLFFIIDFFISEVLIVLYFRVMLPSLVFFDIDAVKKCLVEKFNTYLTDLTEATLSFESSSNILPRAASRKSFRDKDKVKGEEGRGGGVGSKLMRRASSKKLGKKSKKSDGVAIFNSMKYMYLSYKVAKNVVLEERVRVKEKVHPSILLDFVSKMNSIWPCHRLV